MGLPAAVDTNRSPCNVHVTNPINTFSHRHRSSHCIIIYTRGSKEEELFTYRLRYREDNDEWRVLSFGRSVLGQTNYTIYDKHIPTQRVIIGIIYYIQAYSISVDRRQQRMICIYIYSSDRILSRRDKGVLLLYCFHLNNIYIMYIILYWWRRRMWAEALRLRDGRRSVSIVIGKYIPTIK